MPGLLEPPVAQSRVRRLGPLAIVETAKRTDQRCGCATTMRRGCRLPALEIAGVHTWWVHASLAQRHAVLRVLDPEGEPQRDAVSTGDACATGPSADRGVFRAAGRRTGHASQ